MSIQILQQQADSAGNIGYTLVSVQNFDSIDQVLPYLQSLSPGNYMAQLSDGQMTTIIAQVP